MQKELRKTEFWNTSKDQLEIIAAPGTYDLPFIKNQDSHNHG